MPSAAGDPQLCRHRADADAGAALLRRLRRSVRGARAAPAAPRHYPSAAHRRQPRDARLYRPGRHAARDPAALRAEARPDRDRQRHVHAAPQAGRARALLYRGAVHAGGRQAEVADRIVLHRHARCPPRAAPRRRARDRDRDRQRDLQRGGAPLGLRPLHADDRHRSRRLSVCRDSLVQHRLRPRRADHGDDDAVARPGGGARRAALSRRQPGDRDRPRAPTRSRGRSCTRCATARWRN